MTTAQTVAEWLIDRIRAEETLYLEEAVYLIEYEFGSEWVYDDINNSPAIQRSVLDVFRTLHGGAIQWDNAERCWTDSPRRP
ncbi:DUF6953 family protein [Kocuria aegyptia]|uniref:Integron gene cassette protein n=1 Tax=Kocuria aegyptia TaxID=330943 RepID=A0ABN2K8N8_9MICC